MLESVHQAIISSLVIDVSVTVLAQSPYGNPDKSTWPNLFTMDLALRRAIKIPADYVVQLVHIPRGTFISRYSQLWLGFIISAILHHAGAYMLHRNTGSMYFLWISQATMITIEDFIIWLGGKAGIKQNTFTKTLGNIWLCIWLSSPFAGVPAANLFLTAGQAANDPHPIHSILSHFRYYNGCDTFFKIILDRWAVFFVLNEGLEILAARRFSQVLAAVPGVLIAGGLLWSNLTGGLSEFDSTLKVLGMGWFTLHYMYKHIL